MQLNATMIKRACVMAAIVGPVLIAINQGAELAAGGGLSYFKAALTMVVPFLVSLISSALAARERVDAEQAAAREFAAVEEARRAMSAILSNARKVNQVSTERQQMMDGIVQSVQQLQVAIDGRRSEDQKQSVDAIVATLDVMRSKVDAAVEGSAINIRLAEGAAAALQPGRRGHA